MRISLASSLLLSVGVHMVLLWSVPEYSLPEGTLRSTGSALSITLNTAAEPESQVPELPAHQVAEQAPEAPIPVKRDPDPAPEAVSSNPSSEQRAESSGPCPDVSGNVYGIEQNNDLRTEPDVLFTHAIPIESMIPPYPRYCNIHHQQGEVVVEYKVDISGQAFDIRIKKSSGHVRLDRAALKAVEQTSFIPATRNGVPVVSEKEDTFSFIHPGA
ncbi:MAG: energy transducer TonB [Desulfomonilia bacterium]